MAQTRIKALTIARIALLAVCFMPCGWPLFAKPADSREADRSAINAVLKAQQAAWNRDRRGRARRDRASTRGWRM